MLRDWNNGILLDAINDAKQEYEHGTLVSPDGEEVCIGGSTGSFMEAPDVLCVLQAEAAERDPDEELERLGLCDLSQEQMDALGKRFYGFFRATEG